MLAVRPATQNDVDFLVSTQEAPHARGFIHPATRNQIIAAFENPERATFVISDDDKPVGMLLFAYERDNRWLIELRRIVVMVPGRGVGSFALNWLVDWCFNEIGVHRVWLEVVESNAQARHVYEGAGFQLEGTYRDGFRDEVGRYANLCVYGMLKTD